VPPLRIAVRDAIDTKGNPFYRRAARQLFLALRNDRPVGRIAAIENRGHNEFHGDRVGFFGFFECIDEPAIARALFDAASTWLAGRGLGTMRGPMNPSTNDECGLLIDGFQHHPMIMTTWNPPYYAPLVEGAGLEKVKDLVAFYLPMAGERAMLLPERYQVHAERALRGRKLVFRDLSLKRFDREVELCWGIYNAAWERNWGFVPMAKAEFLHLAGVLRHILLPQFTYMAEIDDEPAAFSIVVPDYNEVFKRIPNGRLFPTGLFKILRAKSRIRSGRMMALGIKPEHRKRGLLPLFVNEAFRRGVAYGARGAEASWILEDNVAMIRPMEALGLTPYRRWRIYEKPVAR
jgi:GNAT superfamily N-acetyltransferase